MMTSVLVPCHRCRGRTAAPSEGESSLQSLIKQLGGDWRTTRLLLCPECIVELVEIIERADHGGFEAKKKLHCELAKLLESLGIDDSE
jgi:hypothetical protein